MNKLAQQQALLSDALISIMVDTFDIAVGAVLQQLVDNTWQPISFFSRKLTVQETRYSTLGRELLAIYLAIHHFRHSLEGRQFFIHTDHKPLIYAITSNNSSHTPREIHQLAYISEFTTDIRHISGATDPVTGALS